MTFEQHQSLNTAFPMFDCTIGVVEILEEMMVDEDQCEDSTYSNLSEEFDGSFSNSLNAYCLDLCEIVETIKKGHILNND